jgi:hypothetical protein
MTYRKLNELDPTNKFECTGPDPNILAIENDFVLTKDMLPRYVSFSRGTDKRGSYFELMIPDHSQDKRIYKIRKATSRSIKVSLKDKYDCIKEIVNDNNQ